MRQKKGKTADNMSRAKQQIKFDKNSHIYIHVNQQEKMKRIINVLKRKMKKL